MEHQDRADPFEEPAQQGVDPAEIERIESGADDGRFHRAVSFAHDLVRRACSLSGSCVEAVTPAYHAALFDEFTPMPNFAGG